MGLTQKVLVFISLIVVALAATTLIYTTRQADALAHRTVQAGLGETRDVWDTFQKDRYSKLTLGVRALANDPYFKPLVETRDQDSVADTLKERGQDIKADFFIATDPAGVVIARSDRPGSGEDLSQDPVVMKPLEGDESATVWRQGERLYHAVAVPMVTGNDLKGVLIAGYAINEGLAGDIRKLTHSEIAYLVQEKGKPPALSVSSLGPKESALRAALDRPEFASAAAEPFEVALAGEPHIGVVVPLLSAAGEAVGAVVALRSLATEMASFRQFRNSLVQVSLVVMAAALVLAYVAARRITDPVRTLVSLVERARDGSYAGAVSVSTRDEIGVLARAFNSLLADLREKEQMIGFLREGMTTMLKKGGATLPQASSDMTSAETASLSSMPTAVKMETGSHFAGRYEILSMLGKGGMGVVYKAHDRQLDDDVALKVLRPDVVKDDPTLLERFKQEIKLARKITHRCVLRTHDFGEADGTPYISMEFLEGVTLKDLLRNKGALPIGVGLRIAKQMCQGLDAAHRQGVVHRDVKPQNMLILPETGELKIMDFGIARAATLKQGESGLTTAGTVMGTPDYMPPEQAQGAAADFRSDIYSLGVVLFEVFTGRLPFGGDTAMKVVMAHIQQPAPAPRTLNPRLPVELEAVIVRCLAKSPDQRPEHVADVLKDLTAVSSQAEAGASAA
ncbi:MAG TPA: protein kinase [Vicinamibacteria bacterium]|nr:protein kinase [Vicinamibacteria bacterium]